MKIVINADFGAFGLSKAAFRRYIELKGTHEGPVCKEWNIPRDDPALVQMVTELGTAANGPYASLKIVEIPDDVAWTIEEEAGREEVAEAHRTWS